MREFFIDNLLVRIHFIILMIRWTGLAPWEFAFTFPGSLTSTFLERGQTDAGRVICETGMCKTKSARLVPLPGGLVLWLKV